MNLWKLISPWVVFAVKSGAVSLIRSDIAWNLAPKSSTEKACDPQKCGSLRIGRCNPRPRYGRGSVVDLRDHGVERLLRNRHTRGHSAPELEQLHEIPA